MVDIVQTPPIFHHDLLSQYMLATSQCPSINTAWKGQESNTPETENGGWHLEYKSPSSPALL